ncbi:hypothetical protein Tco_0706368 [Tanacetum coccineum]|uniref:RNA-directed DNA polymerase, eukaryota, reverse transcriptase zinc-binding domain protein n=1 Tax=Tanacetum coccineum TaxID=301880 RepID=A0ABQ4Y9E2_9ASTR
MDKKVEDVNLVNQYIEATKDELKLLQQTTKIKWMKEGDKNSTFFHNVPKSRKHKSRAESICCEDGSRFLRDKVAEEFVSHFKNFLGNFVYVMPLRNLGDIAKLKLFEEDANSMITEVTDEDIKNAMFDIDSSKVAGLDRFTSCFFKKSWHCISKDICLGIKEYFNNGKILGEINATLIALVPKIDTPNKVLTLNQ